MGVPSSPTRSPPLLCSLTAPSSFQTVNSSSTLTTYELTRECLHLRRRRCDPGRGRAEAAGAVALITAPPQQATPPAGSKEPARNGLGRERATDQLGPFAVFFIRRFTQLSAPSPPSFFCPHPPLPRPRDLPAARESGAGGAPVGSPCRLSLWLCSSGYEGRRGGGGGGWQPTPLVYGHSGVSHGLLTVPPSVTWGHVSPGLGLTGQAVWSQEPLVGSAGPGTPATLRMARPGRLSRGATGTQCRIH